MTIQAGSQQAEDPRGFQAGSVSHAPAQRKAIIAMSGGVDSSVAALLCQRQGFDCMGVTLKLYDNQDAGLGEASFPGEKTCCSVDDVADARSVAFRLGMPFYVFNFKEAFRREVMDRFAAAYQHGETPNPCVDCNRGIKFGELLRRSLELGAEAVATGHYVRMERDGATGRCLLKKALHPEKDQSYVLYSLTQEQLSRSRFPLGGLSKEEIRAIAARQGFGNAEKKESQDICFIPDGDYAAFLRRYMGREYPPGPFLDQNGRRLGTHEGIVSYTVGQRRGLGISSEGRLYVKELRPEDNAVVLSDNAALFTRVLTADRLNLIPTDSLSAPIRAKARIRYRQQEQPCTIEQTGPDTVRVEFDQPQRAVTPGQAVVFYDGDLVIGGATIQKGRES